jgi:hypothetical protein
MVRCISIREITLHTETPCLKRRWPILAGYAIEQQSRQGPSCEFRDSNAFIVQALTTGYSSLLLAAETDVPSMEVLPGVWPKSFSPHPTAIIWPNSSGQGRIS